ncbi:MAG: alpha/beta fold hydrolase [Deltaproteobacteria bacterium]|nr:alpha/beta fold hydrolase [Deltaproteobacteria bacterium]
MPAYVPWDSQDLDEWGSRHAQGTFIDLEGHTTHYLEKGTGKPIILIHGFFYNSCMWEKNFHVLAEKFRVFAIDLWGFGYSTREPLDYGYPLYEKQIFAFMDALGIEKATLIGQSMGGGTCLRLAAHHRDRVENMVLVSPAGLANPYPFIARLPTLPGVGEFLLRMPGNISRRIILWNFFYNRKLITDSDFEKVTRPHKIRGSAKAMLKILRARFFDTLISEIKSLGETDIPTLIVWGRQDKGIPLEKGIQLNSIIKESRLEILDRAGHCPQDEQSAEFNRLVLDFLASK